ncbi:hypothetical protein M433DRAFT_60097 [Acidomyces richmondensis BFW]|nr:MAG: hypothetical protein FE78DRAFT_66005 [Acidomyces sp. 'richmondensis']KYG48966.1 hypothetical protein M433DRAFT_60097 [Acidomyces richmondensis BFW]
MEPNPATAPAAAHTKQYVFVDEYNRHKRLKVMRACDGCRKRKIRCDGALQNGPWPCGACQRLKLKCVPPTLDPDDEQQAVSATAQGQFTFQANSFKSNGPPPPKPAKPPQWTAGLTPPSTTIAPLDGAVYSSQFFNQHAGSQLGPRPTYSNDEYFASATGPSQFQQSHQMPSLLRTQTEASEASSGDPHEVDATVKELTGQMGDLSIDITSIAPYIANEKKSLAETPAVEEVEVLLPPSVSSDSTVRIPPEMMPSEERAMDYFGYFFNYIHPYVPVLNRRQFYEQWRSARHSLSPLLLEGVFACVARYLEESIEVRKWLALAARHEESFKDVPRLSTIQAMLLLTKAREFVPKRGYYYRSWMTVKYMTTMAFDLSLHEHYDNHRGGNRCKLSKADCLVRTRIWQTLFNLEILVGAPQGRTDFAVDLETLDLDEPTPSPDVEPFELATSRRFTFMAQCFRNIKQTNILWQNMRRYKTDWALDPAFVQHNEDLSAWLKQLPSDVQLQYADDGRPPWLGGDHFVGYLHTYHHLVVIMHHRPQLQARLEKRDPNFRVDLDICLESAMMMCRTQEALVNEFGLHGLNFMQRGIGFTIYCVLTCTMLHLAAITSPDPKINTQGRVFFTRHMRILEQCITSATPEMQAQINALREAFSNDTSKPFELKPTLGLRSPALENHPTPPELRNGPSSLPVHGTPAWSGIHDAASSKTLSPSSEYANPYDHATHGLQNSSVIGYRSRNFQSSPGDQFAHHTLHQVTSAPQTGYALEPVISNEQQTPVWDPSGLFQQWNSAFGPTPQQPSPNAQAPTSMSAISQQQSPTTQPAMYGTQSVTPNAVSLVHDVPAIPTVTPVMWQDAFTTAYVSGHGNKRYRPHDLDNSTYTQFPKRRG